jgi:hypothetical protein
MLDAQDQCAADEPPLEVECFIPNSISIGKTAYGLGLFSVQSFNTGDRVYTGKFIPIPNKPGTVICHTNRSDVGDLRLDVVTHSVVYNDSTRLLYTYDALMNHSCDPTTRTAAWSGSEEEMKHCEYTTMALKDIQPDDEITTDYEIFEYDCSEKGINACGCGSHNCRGRIHGFKYMDVEERFRHYAKVDPNVREMFLADCSLLGGAQYTILPDSGANMDAVKIVHDDPTNWHLITTRDVGQGEVLYTNTSYLFDMQLADFNKIIYHLTDVGLSRKIIALYHTVSRYNTRFREYYGWDTFQQHSCDPNCVQNYLDPEFDFPAIAEQQEKKIRECEGILPNNSADRLEFFRLPGRRYTIVACRDIPAGSVVTADYYTFDDQEDGTEFECQCGAACCRGIIKG